MIGKSKLEFEEFPAQVDIQVSKIIETRDAGKIRAIITSGDSVVLTAVGQRNNNTVIVTGGPVKPCDMDGVIFAGFWETAIDIVETIGKKIFGDGDSGSGNGGSKSCTTTTVDVKIGEGGKVESITTTTKTC